MAETETDREKQRRTEVLGEGLYRLYGLVERLDQSAKDARFIRNLLSQLTLHVVNGSEFDLVKRTCEKFGCVHLSPHYHPSPTEEMLRVGEAVGEHVPQMAREHDDEKWSHEVHDIFLCGASLYGLLRGRVFTPFGRESGTFEPAGPAEQFYVPFRVCRPTFRRFTLQYPLPVEKGQ